MILDIVLSLLLGSAIGLSLGALGGGGSILTVPALVYALGVSPRHSTGASLLIVGLSSLIGMLGHSHARRVRWRTGTTVGVVSIVGSLVGTAVNKRIDPNLLLLIFAILMFTVAAVMIRREGQTATPTDAMPPAPAPPAAVRKPESTALHSQRQLTASPARHRPRPQLVIGVGVVVGFLTGFLGVGGGFIIVPGLVLALGFELADAVGTSLLIIAISSAFAIAERGGVHGVAPHILWPFAGTAMAAALLGNQIASHVPVRRLNQGFIILVISVATYVTIRSVLALS